MFTCGLFRSNFSFAISPRSLEGLRDLSLIQRRRAETLHFLVARSNDSETAKWSGGQDLNPRPSAWKAETLPLSYPRSFPATFVHCFRTWIAGGLDRD